VHARAVSQDMCAQLESCDESRWIPPEDRSPQPFFYDPFPFIPTDTSDIGPADQALLLSGAEQICSDLTTNSSWVSCRWALPATGIYALVACTAPKDFSDTVCAVTYRGKLDREWEDVPFAGPLPSTWQWRLPEDAEGFLVGGDAHLELESPVDNATMLLVRFLVIWFLVALCLCCP
jgi:hypothetical protein